MSRIGAGAAAAFLAAATIVTASAHAPSVAQAPGAPRVTVRLDVRAEDASGHLVRDLTASDFRVFENGRRQTLTSVSLVDLPIVRPVSGALPAPKVARDVASNLNGGAHGRSYVLFMHDSTLDDITVPGVSAAYRTLAREFVEQHVMPGDLAGLAVTPSTSRMPRSLTDNHAALLEAIDHIPSGLHSTGENGEPFNAKLAAVADYLGDAPGGRRAIVTFMTLLGSKRDRPSRSLFALRETFRSASQPKDWLLELMRATARANVVVYAIDPIRGRAANVSLAPAPPSRLASEAAFGQSLTEFTSWTGGFAITAMNDFSRQLERIVEDVSAFYFLDYVSSDQKLDGKYRDLRVEVTRAGVTVRTRLGYVAPKKS